MRVLKTLGGLAAAVMLLSGCNSGSASASPTLAVKGSATVFWTSPTMNTNGTALTDLAGYYIHYGNSPTSLNQEVNVPSAGAVSFTVSGLTAGTWYFSVSAYTNTGTQSSDSAVGSKTIT